MGGACGTRETRNSYKILSEKLKGREHSEDLSIDGQIIQWILGKSDGKVWTGCISLRIGTSGGFLSTR
jgi:hypothetical protein